MGDGGFGDVDDVLGWADNVHLTPQPWEQAGQYKEARFLSEMEEWREEAETIARAMRVYSVWLKHVEKLRRFADGSDRPTGHASYSTINRQTLVKALKALIADMVAAEKGEAQ